MKPELALFRLACFLSACLVAALLGQWIGVTKDQVSICWLPGAIYFAILLKSPPRRWMLNIIAILAAEVALHVWLYRLNVLTSVYIGLGHMVAVVASALLFRTCCASVVRMESIRELWVLALACLAGPAVGTIVSVMAEVTLGDAGFPAAWRQRWMGDVAGLFIGTPLILTLLQNNASDYKTSPARFGEIAALLLTTIAVFSVVCTSYFPLASAIILPMLWAGVRFGPTGCVFAATALALMGARFAAACHGWSVSQTVDANAHAFLVQSSLVIAGITIACLMVITNRRKSALLATAPMHEAAMPHSTQPKPETSEFKDGDERLRRLSAHQDAMLEAERSRIAREIHDDLGAAMTGVNMQLQLALAVREGMSPEARARLVESLKLIDTANQSIQRIIGDLRPSVLDHLGIWGGLEWLANQWQARTGLPCEITIDSALLEYAMDDDRATAVFRIAQESLTNVVRHAHATRVDIDAYIDGTDVCMTIQDDGKGIEAKQLLDLESPGLLGMHERARRIGGTLRVTGEAGHGTLVILRLPMPI